MSQIKFGKRYAAALHGNAKRTSAVRALAVPDERFRMGLLIATGVLTGFVIAAIECL